MDRGLHLKSLLNVGASPKPIRNSTKQVEGLIELVAVLLKRVEDLTNLLEDL